MDSALLDRRESGGFTFTSDALGDAVVLTVDLAVFEKAAVFKAAYWATEKAYLFFLPSEINENAQTIQIEIRPKLSGKETAEQLGRDFANSLVDHQTRQIVLRETANARDALLKRAFGEGHKHLDPDRLP